MAVNEGLKPVSSDQVPADPNVRIPDHVAAAAAAAEAIHQQYYPKDQARPDAPNKEALPQPPTPEPLHQQAPPAPEPQAQPQQPANEPARAEDQNISADEWRHRFLSMQGRFNSAQRTIGSMEQQMTDLGQELVRTQNMLSQAHSAPPAAQQAPPGQAHNNLITDEDRANYGDELIDLARRSAMSVVAPELERLRDENKHLTARVQSTGKRELFATMDGAVPNWRAINKDVRFISWLRLPNIYTGQLRSKILKDAVDGAEAPKVIALFRDFLSEAAATGQQAPAAQTEQQPTQQVAPREPALNLETLAAPGRARPASGESQVPVDKPIYSRADIARFYEDSRKGLYAGREAVYRATEADLQAAQREGRIRG
jgi:hypothetical protein